MTHLSVLILLGMMLVGLVPTGGFALELVAVTSSPRIELSDKVDWCETAADVDVATVAAGGCRFATGTPASMTRGFTSAAQWLRLTLVNTEPRAVERWLEIGHPRLEWVSLLEATADKGWKRTDTGRAIPPADRPIFSADPVLPLDFQAGERRTILVRVASRTSIDLEPTLWQPQEYWDAYVRTAIFYALVIGGLLAAAAFTLLIFAQWGDWAHFFFTISLIARTFLIALLSGLLPTYLWPRQLPININVQALAGVCVAISFLLFVYKFVGSGKRYRRHYMVLAALAALFVAAGIWAYLVDYRSGAQALLGAATILEITTLILFARAWRDGFRPARFMLWSGVIFVATQLAGSVYVIGGSGHGDIQSMVYTLGFVLGTPYALFGIAEKRVQMRRQLEAAQMESTARLDFLARMSHELRTPLNTILGIGQLLSRPTPRLPLAEGLADILHSGRHLLRMIDDILDHARGAAGRLALVPAAVDWPSFLRGVEQNARLLARRNGNEFLLRCWGPPLRRIQLDEGRLRQVLDNLLVNAARHTKDGRIFLECVARRVQGGVWLDFAVADSGEGILPADRERIFQPFERGSGSSCNDRKGVGMGLAIARQLVEMMGGTLTVESTPGKGACFRFGVAAEEVEAYTPTPSVAARPGHYSGQQRTILVIEDEDDSRWILAALLRDAGFEVVTATSGRAGAGLCAATAINLVLTDQFMADGDGWAVLKSLAVLRPELPVVLVSAAPPHRPDDFPPHLEFAAYLPKPLDHAKTLRCVGDVLGLDWADDTVEASPPPPDCRPDSAEMAALRTMTDNGQISDIMAWADLLKKREPRYAGFADSVHTAARRLDFPALEELAG